MTGEYTKAEQMAEALTMPFQVIILIFLTRPALPEPVRMIRGPIQCAVVPHSLQVDLSDSFSMVRRVFCSFSS